MSAAATPDLEMNMRVVSFTAPLLADALRRVAAYIEEAQAHMFTDSAVVVVCEGDEWGNWCASVETDITLPTRNE
jgi:hypothetical protein